MRTHTRPSLRPLACRRSRRRTRTGALIAIIVVGMAGCDRAAQTGGASDARGFVGRESCAECHAEPSEKWTGSHHDLAMQIADEATVLGDFGGTSFTQAGVTTSFRRAGADFVVTTDGPDGELADYTIAYTFGVEPLQQYLVEFPGGRLQPLPIAWDTRPAPEGGQRWFHVYGQDSIPAGDPFHWTGPNQTWNYQCAECHSTDLQRNYVPEENAYETAWAEIDVSCEACHGPGDAHVDWARRSDSASYASPEEIGLAIGFRDRANGVWIRGESEPTAARSVPRDGASELAACGRCHARRSVIADPYEYGSPLPDTHEPRLLEPGLYFADGQVLDEVYVWGSFLQSRMYAAGVVCSDCHDPHSLTLRAEGNALCTTCHAPDAFDTASHHFHEPGSSGAQCVSCHMPERAYMVVDQRRDHGIRVPRPDLSVLGTPDACTGCHVAESPAWAAATIDDWYGAERARERRATPHYGQILGSGRLGLPAAEPRLAELVANREQPAIVRATAAQMLSRYPTAASMEAIRRALEDPSPLVRAAAVQSLEPLDPMDRAPLAFHMLSDRVKTVRLAATRMLVSVPTEAWTTSQRVTLNGAIEEYVAAQHVNADRPEAHMNLGVLEQLRGRYDDAETAYRRAIAVGDWFVPAYINLADLYRLRSRDAEGEALLREALSRSPEDATLHQALGLNLVRQGRTAEALSELRTAAELSSGNPQMAYMYAVALNSTGDEQGAVAVLEDLLEAAPFHRDALIALAVIEARRGETERAREIVGRILSVWPDDPTGRSLAEQLQSENP